MKIKRIAEIKNFSIFKDFDWASNLSYQIKENTEIYDFKDINILYGRNGFVAQRFEMQSAPN